MKYGNVTHEPLEISSFPEEFLENNGDNSYKGLRKGSTWVLVDLPPRANSVNSKWIFKRKYNPDGSIEKNIRQG